MPKAPQHHALARQWQLLRLLPTNPPGITARELMRLLNKTTIFAKLNLPQKK